MIARALLVVAMLGAAAHADDAAKKDVARAGKSRDHAAVLAAGARAPALVNLYNSWTDEWLAVDPRARPDAATLDRFLRDHYTGRVHHPMEPRLLGFLLAAAAHFHSDTVTIVSGFRHPKYNLILRKKGHQVARDSEHTHGNAVDFAVPRVATRTLQRWALDQHAGGVGLYLDSGFVHMDTGPVRTWSGE